MTDRLIITPSREIEPTEPDEYGNRWRQFVPTGVRVEITGTIDNPARLLTAIREALEDNGVPA